MTKKYWLLKSEPSTWSWDDQVKSKIDMWDGVRNYQARNNLMKMKKGDILIRNHSIWHRGTKNKSKNLRILLLFELTEKSTNKNFKQEIYENLKIGENQFKSTYSQKFKEAVSIYLSPVYILYRMVLSIIK